MKNKFSYRDKYFYKKHTKKILTHLPASCVLKFLNATKNLVVVKKQFFGFNFKYL